MTDRRIEEHRSGNECSQGANMPEKPGESGRLRRPELPQFGLRGLFVFFTWMTICISLAATALRTRPASIGCLVLLWATVDLAWVVFLITYQKLGLRAPLFLHWLGPVVAFAVALMVALFVGVASRASLPVVVLLWAPLGSLGVASSVGCLLGLALSVSWLAVAMAAVLFEGPRKGTP
ncbi:MAG: hypothetical protein ACYTG0_02290 [Planctomycetota bacterium]|jgi:hypothetical protein